MKLPHSSLILCASACSILVAWSAACSGTNPATFGQATGAGGNGSGAGSGTGTGNSGATGVGGSSGVFMTTVTGSGTGTSSGAGCSGLDCQIHACTGGASTNITGTVYDPAGKNPLYGIVAYVPNTKPSPITSGASCYSCGDLYTGDPIASAVTDAYGNFTIKNAPDGANIPLVIQVGKWRRQFVLPTVTKCGSTAVPDLTLTLPKNGTEGDLPNIAVSTGSADTLECLLSRVGVDKAEYVPGASGNGHIHIFMGNNRAPNTSPAAPDPSVSLWDSAADIMKYDILLLSCEGEETLNMNQQVLFDYAAAGGRAFASHYHYAWFNTGPFSTHNLATWYTGGNDLGNINASVVTSFPKGQDFHDWLAGPKVNALTNNLLPIQVAKHNADVAAANTPSQPWLQVSTDTQQAQDFTFDTPFDVDAGAQCGRIAYSDMHVGAGDGDYMGGLGKTTPAGCADVDLSPQEKALEFILFDLSSCVTPGNITQQPPPTMPPPT